MKIKVNSGSMTPTQGSLRNRTELIAPVVYYTPRVQAQINALVEICKDEVGWYGLVDYLDSGDYLVTEIFVPKQKVSSVETDIDDAATAELFGQLMDQNKAFDEEGRPRLIYWAHSHVNMGVRPSGQDERQVEEWLENSPLLIRAIYNKRGERKIDVYDVDADTVFQCVTDGVIPQELTADEYQALEDLVKRNVEKRVYAPSPQTWKGQGAATGYPVPQTQAQRQIIDQSDDLDSWGWNNPNYNQSTSLFQNSETGYGPLVEAYETQTALNDDMPDEGIGDIDVSMEHAERVKTGVIIFSADAKGTPLQVPTQRAMFRQLRMDGMAFGDYFLFNLMPMQMDYDEVEAYSNIEILYYYYKLGRNWTSSPLANGELVP